METINLVLIIFTFFVVSFLNSLTGGGALITIPVLIFSGVNPLVAVGTNKIGSLGLGVGGSIGYEKEKKLDYKLGIFFMLLVSTGAIVGSIMILSVPEKIIEKVIGILMIVIVGFLIFENKIKFKRLSKNKNIFFILSVLCGIYYGFYGAGVGIINRFILYAFHSLGMLASAAISVFTNIGASLISLIIFTYGGVVDYSLALPIFVSSVLGAYFGARYGSKIGGENIKKLVIITATVFAIKLLFF